jgi:hypothetical protein
MTTQTWSQMYDEAGEADQILPDAEYDFTIMKSEYKKTSNGKDMFVIRAAVVGGPYDRKVVFHNFVVSNDNPTAMQIFFRQMNALGLSKSFWKTNPSNDSIATALANRRFRGVVGSKSYQGTDKNEIKSFRVAGTAGVASAPPAPPAMNGAPQPPTPAPVSYLPSAPQPVPTQEVAPPATVPSAPQAPATPAPPPPPPAQNAAPAQNGHTAQQVAPVGTATLPPPPELDEPPFSGGF